MKRFGITGGIACGKSTTGNMLQKLGWCVIDTDSIVHDLYKVGNQGYKKIIDAFGQTILNKDGSINRSCLGQIIFPNSEKRSLLNSLIHPLVRTAWQREYDENLKKNPGTPVVVIVPLLYETEADHWFQSIACIACGEQLQKHRLASKNMNKDQIQMRLQSQMELSEKIKRSDITLWNNGSIDCLQNQVALLDRIWREWFQRN